MGSTLEYFFALQMASKYAFHLNVYKQVSFFIVNPFQLASKSKLIPNYLSRKQPFYEFYSQRIVHVENREILSIKSLLCLFVENDVI